MSTNLTLVPGPLSSAAPAADRPMPRTLAGWPEGCEYVPRTPVLYPNLALADAYPYEKQHRGRGRARLNGDGE